MVQPKLGSIYLLCSKVNFDMFVLLHRPQVRVWQRLPWLPECVPAEAATVHGPATRGVPHVPAMHARVEGHQEERRHGHRGVLCWWYVYFSFSNAWAEGNWELSTLSLSTVLHRSKMATIGQWLNIRVRLSLPALPQPGCMLPRELMTSDSIHSINKGVNVQSRRTHEMLILDYNIILSITLAHTNYNRCKV